MSYCGAKPKDGDLRRCNPNLPRNGFNFTPLKILDARCHRRHGNRVEHRVHRLFLTD